MFWYGVGGRGSKNEQLAIDKDQDRGRKKKGLLHFGIFPHRCLRSTHLAPFLGMSRMEESAVFLFVGDLISAHRYLSRGFYMPCEIVPCVLNGVLNGLMYLHHEGLVHMELSLDTIMVSGCAWAREFSSLRSLDRLGRPGDMMDDSAEILFQSFLQKTIVSCSAIDTDVHSCALSITISFIGQMHFFVVTVVVAFFFCFFVALI